MRGRSPPLIELRNIQRRIRVAVPKLQQFAEVAGLLVWKNKRLPSEIMSLDRIYVLMVSDRRMAALHQKFRAEPGPTDVLTFQHGEIVISVETAARQARMFHNSLTAEIQLYLMHGLLHLAGFDDVTARDRRRMDRLQKKLLAIALRHL